jgi:hypothetical protein
VPASFGTAINCIDGRVQLPVINWMREFLALDYVDLVTQPGADALLAEDAELAGKLVLPRVQVSVSKHMSPVVAVVGHFGCAANPVEDSVHRAQLERAVATVKEWQLGVKVMALWVNGDWRVDVVKTRAA